MERAHERGYARSIGVSNFSVAQLDELLSVAETRPVVNQVQFNPFAYRRSLLEACEERDVALEAYSPLGTGRHLSDERVRQLAERVGRTPAQVLLRWCVQRDLVVIPKSTHRERIAENAEIFDFALSDEDMAALDALDETGGTVPIPAATWPTSCRTSPGRTACSPCSTPSATRRPGGSSSRRPATPSCGCARAAGASADTATRPHPVLAHRPADAVPTPGTSPAASSGCPVSTWRTRSRGWSPR